MTATIQLEKFAGMKRNRNISVKHTHSVSQVNRMELSFQIEQRFLAGRDDPCYLCLVPGQIRKWSALDMPRSL
eukprot:6416013-Pyramimonas_sp.AAC.1